MRQWVTRRYFLTGLWASLLAAGCGPGARGPVPLTLSAAASLQPALTAILPQFHRRYPDIAVVHNAASSGTLQRQIEQGAPVDVFFPAASQPMDALAAKGLIVAESRRDLLTNRLVLIAPEGAGLGVTSFGQLQPGGLQRLAVGEFRSVPAGQYARQVFEHLGLLPSLEAKLVFGNNVRSVLAAVEGGHVDGGVVYATDAAQSQRVRVLAMAPPEAHAPIVYPIAVVKASRQRAAAQALVEFLASDGAQAVFTDFGFGPVE